MNKVTQAALIATGAFVTTMSLGLIADARADGYDPDLMQNSRAICVTIDDAVSVDPIHDLFLIYGRQYTVDAVHAVCPENDLRAYAGLLSYDVPEDGPDWDCTMDGNRVCGPNNEQGVPAGQYDQGGVLIRRA